MLSDLYRSTGEAYDQQHLAIDIKVDSDEGRYLILCLLSPEPLLATVNPVGTIDKRVAKDLLVDLPEVLNLGLLIDVEDHLFPLEDADREVV